MTAQQSRQLLPAAVKRHETKFGSRLAAEQVSGDVIVGSQTESTDFDITRLLFGGIDQILDGFVRTFGSNRDTLGIKAPHDNRGEIFGGIFQVRFGQRGKYQIIGDTQQGVSIGLFALNVGHADRSAAALLVDHINRLRYNPFDGLGERTTHPVAAAAR